MNTRCPDSEKWTATQRVPGGRRAVRGAEFGVQGPGEGVRSTEYGVRGGGRRLLDSGFRVPASAFSIRHSAFTLVELLVTITIIGILTGLALGGVHYARKAAAEAKTKATIAKLHAIIMQRYESYMTRRVPLVDIKTGLPFNLSTVTPRDAARMRLDGIRDLMRMEMPERWSDADMTNTPPLAVPIANPLVTGPAISAVAAVPAPALTRAYFERYSQAVSALVNKGMNLTDAKTKVKENGGPECLYMIVSMGNPEAMEQFGQDEVGDVDGDGLPEFIDGWGMPVSFLRWAPGFNDSDLQANINSAWNDATAIQQRQAATTYDHDPYDTQKVDLQKPDETNTSVLVPVGWRLWPLIYSFGPDKKEGLCAGEKYNYRGNPYETITFGGKAVGIGTPDGTGQHCDNIHNHRIEQK